MKLSAVLYFMCLGYLLAKRDLDKRLWEAACKAHDRWVVHVTGLARKELT